MSRRPARRRRLLLAGFVVFTLGCGGWERPGPPWRYPTTRVKGRLTVQGRPVGAGWITLFPIDQTVGDALIAPLDADGRFDIPAAPIGPTQIRIALDDASRQSQPELASWLGRYRGGGSPVLTRVDAGDPFPLDIDLAFFKSLAKG